MLYEISPAHTGRHLISVTLSITDISEDRIFVNLPSWRPGRYELANFAKNVYKVTAEDGAGRPLKIEKVSKDKWEVFNNAESHVKIRYLYYANQSDAGGSVVDESQVYINFINCLLYVENRLEEPCEVQLQIPDDYIIACGLDQPEKNVLSADSYYHLVDSPMMASASLQHLSYELDSYSFHLWINGQWKPDAARLISYFKAFTAAQLETMEGFPCQHYHFLFQILPYKFYHGVEHFNSTVITLGPDEDIETLEGMENLLGVSSHELFHTWNIIRIRPKEMLPYRFSQENYFKTGFVAEGFTTYYGDVFLLRGKVFSPGEYFDNLNKSLKRHFENYGRFNLSLAESSYDLWLDGYSPGIPDRKVSIYVKGSLVALMLDLTIRKCSENHRSLDDLMRKLWKDFGVRKVGYTEHDIQSIAEELSGNSLEEFFQQLCFWNYCNRRGAKQAFSFYRL